MIHSSFFNYDELDFKVNDGTTPSTSTEISCRLSGTVECLDNNIRRVIAFNRWSYAVVGSTTILPEHNNVWEIYVSPLVEPESLYIVAFDYNENFNSIVYDRITPCTKTFQVKDYNYNFMDYKGYQHTGRDPLLYKRYDTMNISNMGDVYPYSVMKSLTIADLFSGAYGETPSTIDWSVVTGNMVIIDDKLTASGIEGVASNNSIVSNFQLLNHCEVETRYYHNFYGEDSSFIDFVLEQDSDNKFLMRLKSWSNGYYYLNTYAAHAFRIEPLTGQANGREWFAKSPSVTNQCLVVSFPNNTEIDKIVINNSHDNGILTENGVRQTKIIASYSGNFDNDFSDESLADAVLFDSVIPQHTNADIEDPFDINIITPKRTEPINAKSIKFKISDNHGATDYIGIRNISFYRDGNLIPYDPLWECLTSDLNVSYPPENAFAHINTLDGDNWYTNSGTVTNTTLVINFPENTVIDNIKYSNSHANGGSTNRGIKNISIIVHETENFSTSWDETITGMYEIYNGIFAIHNSLNVLDYKRVRALKYIDNYYTGFKLKIKNNYGNTGYIAIRSIEFKKGGILIPYDPSWSLYSSSYYSMDYVVSNAFNTSISKIGVSVGNEWKSANGLVTDQYLIVNFNAELDIDEIVINNGHNSGIDVNSGAKDYEAFVLRSGAFSDQIENELMAIYISSGTLPQHIAANMIDDISKPLIYPKDPMLLFDFKGDYLDLGKNQYKSSKFDKVTIVDGYRGEMEAIRFDGSSGQHFSVEPVEELRITGDITINVLFMAESSGIVYTCSNDGEVYANNILYDLRVYPNGYLCIYHEYGNGTNYELITTYQIEYWKWYNITITRDSINKVYRLYSNGVEVYKATYATNPAKNTAALNTQYVRLGSFSNNTSLLIGTIGDFRVYNRALSPEEVAILSDNLMNCSLYPKSIKFKFYDNYGGSYMSIRDIAFISRGERIAPDESSWSMLASSSNPENGGHTMSCYKVESGVETQIGTSLNLTNRYGIVRFGRGYKGDVYFQYQNEESVGPIKLEYIDTTKAPENRKNILAYGNTNITGPLKFKIEAYTQDACPVYKTGFDNFKAFADDINYNYSNFDVTVSGIGTNPNETFFSLPPYEFHYTWMNRTNEMEEVFINISDRATINTNRIAANKKYDLNTNILLSQSFEIYCTLNLGSEPLVATKSYTTLRIEDYPPRVYQNGRDAFVIALECSSSYTNGKRIVAKKLGYSINGNRSSSYDGWSSGTEIVVTLPAGFTDDVQVRMRRSDGSLFCEYYDGSTWVLIHEFIHVYHKEYKVLFEMLSYGGLYPKYVSNISITGGRLVRKNNALYTIDFSKFPDNYEFANIENCSIIWDRDDIDITNTSAVINNGCLELRTRKATDAIANAHVNLDIKQIIDGDFDISIDMDLSDMFGTSYDQRNYFRALYEPSDVFAGFAGNPEKSYSDRYTVQAEQLCNANFTKSILGDRLPQVNNNLYKSMPTIRYGFGDVWRITRNNNLHFMYQTQKPLNSTIECWAKRTGGANSGYNDTQPIVMLGSFETAYAGGYGIIIDKATGKVGFSQSNGKAAIFSNYVISTTVFEHLACVVSDYDIKLYINGTLYGQLKYPYVDVWSTIYIASRNTSYPSSFKGDITEVRIWDTARTQEEIINSATSRLYGTEDGLQAYYPMITNTGSSLVDYSVNCVNLAFYGTYTWVASTLFGDGFCLRFDGTYDCAYGSNFPTLQDNSNGRYHFLANSTYLAAGDYNQQAYERFLHMAPTKTQIISGAVDTGFTQLIKVRKIEIKADGIIRAHNTGVGFYNGNNYNINTDYYHWISKPVVLDSVSGLISNSVISWSYQINQHYRKDVPSDGRNISQALIENAADNRRVYVSYDNGEVWLRCTNGEPIPGLTVGMDTTGLTMLIKMVVDDQNNRILMTNGFEHWECGEFLGLEILIY